MSERRFVIAEIDDDTIPEERGWKGKGIGITESELKRRLIYIVNYVPGVDRAIDILLHGEGKKEHDPWEAWVDKMPQPTEDIFLYRKMWKEWFRKMPPRGK